MIGKVDKILPAEQLYETDIHWHYQFYIQPLYLISPCSYNLECLWIMINMWMWLFAINILSFINMLSIYRSVVSIVFSLLYQALSIYVYHVYVNIFMYIYTYLYMYIIRYMYWILSTYITCANTCIYTYSYTQRDSYILQYLCILFC